MFSPEGFLLSLPHNLNLQAFAHNLRKIFTKPILQDVIVTINSFYALKKKTHFTTSSLLFFSLWLKLCTMQEIITKKAISTPALFFKTKKQKYQEAKAKI